MMQILEKLLDYCGKNKKIMKLEVFKELLSILHKQEEKIDAIYKGGIDLVNFYDDGQNAISILLNVYYGEEGKNWIDWYLYERDNHSGDLLQAIDKDNNPICYDEESLWKEVEQCRLDNNIEYTLPIKLTMEEKIKMLDHLFNKPGTNNK